MLLAIKVALLGLCAVSLVFVALKLILPLIWMYARGVGVEIPLPRRFATGDLPIFGRRAAALPRFGSDRHLDAWFAGIAAMR